MVKCQLKNISGNIEAVFFKLGPRNVDHKRNQMTPIELLPWKLSWLQSLSFKTHISSFSTLLSRTENKKKQQHLFTPKEIQTKVIHSLELVNMVLAAF